jgi:hypothetical protein
MLEAAYEYFQWCVDNPIMDTEAKVVSMGMNMGSSVDKVDIPRMRAFTWQGLCGYLDCNTVYFNQFESSIKEKNDKASKDFSKVITRIRDIIFQQKFEGAAAGFLNHNIIARDLGLVDKKEVFEVDKKRNTIKLPDGTEVTI